MDGRLKRRAVPLPALRCLAARSADALPARKAPNGHPKAANQKGNKRAPKGQPADAPPVAVGSAVVARLGNLPGGRFYAATVTAARRLSLNEVMLAQGREAVLSSLVRTLSPSRAAPRRSLCLPLMVLAGSNGPCGLQSPLH